MAAKNDPLASFRDLFFAPLLPVEAMNHIHNFKETVRNGGCKYDCDYARTDHSRLPWTPSKEYGGWGGAAHFDTAEGAQHTPIVFVHGNQRDACDWNRQAEYFLERGYSGDDLWAITFGAGTPTHDQMAAQLDEFVSHVREYTGCEQVVVIGHSLGVTGTRYWLETHDRYDWVSTFIGLAGANHGLDFAAMCCRFGVDDGPYRTSQFLRSDYERFDDHPLAELNENETPGDVDYYTLRGAHDELFWGNRTSPMLEGAEENLVLSTGHDGVRESEEALGLVFEWASAA